VSAEQPEMTASDEGAPLADEDVVVADDAAEDSDGDEESSDDSDSDGEESEDDDPDEDEDEDSDDGDPAPLNESQDAADKE
jgi:hypothetical protein